MIARLLNLRFVKFGCVGLAGTVVNLVFLYLGQEYLFAGLADDDLRLSASLLVAICVATLHNYLWNQHWTWADRRRGLVGEFFVRMGKYYLSCTFASTLQYLLTMLMTRSIHYMLANITAIGIAAVTSYLTNDSWTFSRKQS